MVVGLVVVVAHSLFVGGARSFTQTKRRETNSRCLQSAHFAQISSKIVNYDSFLAIARHTRCFDKHGVQNISLH